MNEKSVFVKDIPSSMLTHAEVQLSQTTYQRDKILLRKR